MGPMHMISRVYSKFNSYAPISVLHDVSFIWTRLQLAFLPFILDQICLTAPLSLQTLCTAEWDVDQNMRQVIDKCVKVAFFANINYSEWRWYLHFIFWSLLTSWNESLRLTIAKAAIEQTCKVLRLHSTWCSIAHL